MNYTMEEVMQYVQEEDVKFIRLAFCDVFGRQKNIAIMPGELKRAFQNGIAFDASAIAGFGGDVRSDLFLQPDASTLARLTWRPETGRVVRMFCDITYPDGSIFEADTRGILKQAAEDAKQAGYDFSFGPEMEFYLFKTDAEGNSLAVPSDTAGYMDIAPDDKGENVRREICLTLEQMGIQPESSHHEEGHGQNEIDFRFSDPLTAADNTITFRDVVKTIAACNGFDADFSPKPLKDQPGSGMHINISVQKEDETGLMPRLVAGILEKAYESTVFFNPLQDSYKRLGRGKAPAYVTWSHENRSHLIRIPAAEGAYRRMELRSPDPSANPYLAFALLLRAGMYGIENDLEAPPCADFNLGHFTTEMLNDYQRLPDSLEAAIRAAKDSPFIKKHLPDTVTRAYCLNV